MEGWSAGRERRAPLTDRAEAAEASQTCPFAESCGFRIGMPQISAHAKARSHNRNRST
ncbi:hypothetical protein GCM10010341_90670 [Streptomyces noursei]|nr:hypothetical protein GCM10010341_90670 [Streptomyces noursei]